MSAPRHPASTPKKKPSEKRRERQAETEAEFQRTQSPVKGKTPGQRAYLAAIMSAIMTIVVGPAGTGKSYIAACVAAQMLLAGQIKRIVLARPAVEAGEEKHGFLPGDINKKMAPWARPIVDILRKRLGDNRVNAMILSGDLAVEPFTYMRGLTFDDAFIILDEAQNITVPQAKLFTTRIGERTKIVIDGDISHGQNDLEAKGIRSGLRALVEIANGMPDVSVVTLTNDDCVRSAMTKQWVEAWDRFEAAPAVPSMAALAAMAPVHTGVPRFDPMARAPDFFHASAVQPVATTG